MDGQEDGLGRTAATDRSGRRGWRAKLAVGGLLAAAGPLAFAAPASAALNSDESTVSLTFVANGGAAVTCRLEGSGAHETSSTNGFVVGESQSKAGNGQFVDVCKGNHTITIRYRDRGEDRTFESFSYFTDTAYSQVFEGDVSNISIVHSVFFLNCNPGASATCTLATTTNPK
jgi:hypothetical protein